MAQSAYISDNLVSDAKLRAFYPTSGGVISDTDILRLMTDELISIMTAEEMASIQGYLAVETSVPLVGNQSRYPLPYRAAGTKLRYSALVDSQGNRTDLSAGRPERYVFENQVQAVSIPFASWFEGGQLVVYPPPLNAAYNILMGIYLRPGRLVLSSNASQATASCAVGGVTLSCSAVPAHMNGATTIDIIRGLPPFQVIAYDLPVSALSTGATSITVTAPGNPQYVVNVGDYITLPEESVTPQIPAEAYPLLAARTAKRMLLARGDMSNAQAITQDIAEMQSQLFEFMSNRNEMQIDSMSGNQLMGIAPRYALGVGWWSGY